jgi:hypothetical protein
MLHISAVTTRRPAEKRRISADGPATGRDAPGAAAGAPAAGGGVSVPPMPRAPEGPAIPAVPAGSNDSRIIVVILGHCRGGRRAWRQV